MPYIGRNHTSGDHVNNFKVLDDISSYTATFDGTATSVVDTTNDTIRVPEHRFIQGQRVIYTNGGGGNIGGLTTGTAYFIIVDTSNTFKLAASASNASISTAINLSSVGTGTSHTINASFDGVNTRFKITHGNGVRGDINSATQLNIAINNVIQRPNINSASFTEGFSVEDQHKLVFKTAPTSNDIFWGSIIANNLSTFDVSDHKIDTFTGDGSTTEFNLSHTPANNESLMVTINGVLQHPSNATTSRAYSLIGSVLKFTAAPANGDEIQVRHLGFAGATTSDVTGFYGRTGNVVLGSSDNITVGNIKVGSGVTIESNGQATFVGVVTFGSGSTTIDNNVVNVGTALTLGHTQGLQFHTQNLHSAGFEVNQINTSGIITASSLDISGNASIGGVLTYEDVTSIDSVGIITAREGIDLPTDKKILLGDNDKFEIYKTSTHARIINKYGSGSWLRLASGNGVILEADNGNKLVRGIVNGKTELYYSSVLKTETYSNGLRVIGNVAIDESIIHYGDSDTKLNFHDADKFRIELGGLTSAFSGLKSTSGANHARWGINVATPQAVLHIDEVFNHQGLLRVTNGNQNSSYYHQLEMSGTNNIFTLWKHFDGSSTKTTHIHGSTRHAWYIGGEEKVRVHSDGKVGIGTDDPHEELHILNSNPAIKIQHNSGTNVLSTIVQNGPNLKIRLRNGTSNGGMHIQGNDGTDITTFVRVSNTGKVGIGSEIPQAKLDVNAGANVVSTFLKTTSARSFIEFEHNAGSTYNTRFGSATLGAGDVGFVFETGLASSPVDAMVINRYGKVGILTAAPEARLDVYDTSGLGIISRSASTQSTDSNKALKVRNNSTTDTFNVSYKGQGYFAGKVGIGSEIPSQSLDVAGNIKVDGGPILEASTDDVLRITSPTGYVDVGSRNVSYMHFHTDRTKFYFNKRIIVDEGIVASYNDDLVLATDISEERIRIENDTGNVGIGRTAVTKLTVGGDVYIDNHAIISNFDNSGTSGGNVDHIWHSDASNYGRGGTWNFVSDGAFKGAGQSTIQIGYLASAGGGHFSGNVAIGHTSPDVDLDVKSGSTVARFESTSTSTSARVEIAGASNSYSGLHFGDTSDRDNGFIRYYNADDYMILGTSTKERIRIHSDGRVDIGGTNEIQLTSSSNYMLLLHGAIVGSDLDFCYGQRILLDDDDTGTTSADRERGCLYLDFNGNASGGNTTDETRLWNIYSDVDVTADYDLVYGLYSDLKTTHTSGTISEMRGVYALVQSANSGDISNMTGLYAIVQSTTGANTETVGDMIGVRGRVNMCAGTSTANAVDVIGIWGNIDNDNNTAQATGGKCALFYGSYDKTNGLHNPQGIRIDTDVPNYFRGGLALGNGGNFLPVDDHMLHIQDQTNAKGILLRQTGNYYNSIEGDANRTGTGNAILDLRGKWNGTEVTRIRFETGTDTSNKDDGQIQFYTASAGTVTERMHIQPNGEIAVKSNGTPGDAIANLHVQNGTFRVSQANGPTTEYLQVTAHTHNTDGDRHAMRYVSGGTNYMSLSKNGQLGSLHHHFAGRTRSDANTPTNYYAHGSFGFHAYAGRTDDTTNYRTLAFMRAWEAGDTEDRNFMYYVDSTSDTTSVDYDQHQRFGIKASGMLQSREDGWFGRCESDESNPNSVYTTSNTNLVRTWATNGEAQVYMQAAAAPANNIYSFYVETGTSSADDDIQFRIRSSDGRISSDSGAIGTPGDYAECFEWLDGNPSNEDRVGISVVLVGDKIRPANSSDDPSKIIGIVSANPVVVGDAAPLKYHDRYLTDDWGRYIMEDVEMLVWNTGKNEYQPKQTDTFALQNCVECIEVSDIDAALAEGRIKQWVVDQNLRRIDKRRKVNPNFDVTKKDIYKPRLERPEWDAIGMVGKVFMRKGQPTGTNWIKLSDKTASIERWLVR